MKHVRRVKRRQRILKGARRASGSPRKTSKLHAASFDQERLGKQTYLTVAELAAYGRFVSPNAAWLWLGRNTTKVPKCRRGRRVTILRRDYDRAVQPAPRKGVSHGA